MVSNTEKLNRAADIQERLTAALNDSGKFWVEAGEIDGLTDVRLTVSDSATGKWFTLTAETDENEGD